MCRGGNDCLWLVDGEVLREVVLYGGDDGLHELEEHDEVRVHAHLAAALRHRLDYLLHHLCVSGGLVQHVNETSSGKSYGLVIV